MKWFHGMEHPPGWLELIRPPNLFTVPGDVLAGAALAGLSVKRMPALLLAVAVSMMLYLSGLILNDYVDRGRDARERPFRPIPSGRVNARQAQFVSLLLMTLAVFASWFAGIELLLAAAVLAVLILAYDGPARRVPALGFATMGLCRGFNVLVGAGAAGGLFARPPLVGALITTLYIVAVTSLAYTETEGPRAAERQRQIGRLIRGLTFLQIALIGVSAFGNPVWFTASTTALLLLMFLGAAQAARVFYGS
jgi:4-hydroxybenzoate polyprenyltransferase